MVGPKDLAMGISSVCDSAGTGSARRVTCTRLSAGCCWHSVPSWGDLPGAHLPRPPGHPTPGGGVRDPLTPSPEYTPPVGGLHGVVSAFAALISRWRGKESYHVKRKQNMECHTHSFHAHGTPTGDFWDWGKTAHSFCIAYSKHFLFSKWEMGHWGRYSYCSLKMRWSVEGKSVHIPFCVGSKTSKEVSHVSVLIKVKLTNVPSWIKRKYKWIFFSSEETITSSRDEKL